MHEDDRLLKLVDRMTNPLPEYNKSQINRTRKIKIDNKNNLEQKEEKNENSLLIKGGKFNLNFFKNSNSQVLDENLLSKRNTENKNNDKNKNKKVFYDLNYMLGNENNSKKKITSIPDEYYDNLFKKIDIETDSNQSNKIDINSILIQNSKITDYWGNNKDINTSVKKIKNNNITQFFENNQSNLKNKNCNCNDIDKIKNALILKEEENKILEEENKTIKNKYDKFFEKSKEIVLDNLLKLEIYQKKESNNNIIQLKQRLGDLIKVRDGAKFNDVWIDSNQISFLKQKLEGIIKEKDNIEKTKKNLNKKSNYNGNLIDTKLFNESDSNSNTNTIQFSDNINNKEIKERLNFQLFSLNKEENLIKEQLNEFDNERKELGRMIKLNNEELHCRYAKIKYENFKENYPLLNDKYQILRLIGKGGFSEVYKAYDIVNLRFVACKIHQLNPNWSETTKGNYIKHALRENEVHKNLCHPNIVSQFDTVEIDSHTFCTVLEYCDGPDLYHYLKKNKTLSEKETKIIIKQIVNALKFLNQNNTKIIHYDLKPQNILFHNGITKVTDFGLCKIISQEESKIELTSQGLGTYWYLPPECFKLNSQPPSISQKVDVWSIGVIYFELLYGIKPFGNNMSQDQVMKNEIILKAKNIDFPSKPNISQETKDFIKKCLKYNQEYRLSIKEAYDILKKY